MRARDGEASFVSAYGSPAGKFPSELRFARGELLDRRVGGFVEAVVGRRARTCGDRALVDREHVVDVAIEVRGRFRTRAERGELAGSVDVRTQDCGEARGVAGRE